MEMRSKAQLALQSAAGRAVNYLATKATICDEDVINESLIFGSLGRTTGVLDWFPVSVRLHMVHSEFVSKIKGRILIGWRDTDNRDGYG